MCFYWGRACTPNCWVMSSPWTLFPNKNLGNVGNGMQVGTADGGDGAGHWGQVKEEWHGEVTSCLWAHAKGFWGFYVTWRYCTSDEGREVNVLCSLNRASTVYVIVRQSVIYSGQDAAEEECEKQLLWSIIEFFDCTYCITVNYSLNKVTQKSISVALPHNRKLLGA